MRTRTVKENMHSGNGCALFGVILCVIISGLGIHCLVEHSSQLRMVPESSRFRLCNYYVVI